MAVLHPGRGDRYEWLGSNSGPKGCPMEILDGDFLFGRGSLQIPRASVHAGWGREVSIDVVGPDTKPLPDSVAILFFSYLEDKLYRAKFALPRDSIDRLFREGYRSFDDRSGHATYRMLIAGAAPGGAVAVWAAGAERQVEVFFGQAEAADVDWHRAMQLPPDADRHEVVAGELADAGRADSLVPVMMQHVPIGRWAAYRTRYSWRPVFEGIGRPARLDRVEFVNGERDYILLPPDAPDTPAVRPVPRFVLLNDPSSGRTHWLTFDEEEIVAAFARVGAGATPVDLVFAAGPNGTAGVEVSVRTAAATVPLRKVTREVYGAK